MIKLTPKEQRIPWRLVLLVTGATVLLMLLLWPIEDDILRSAGVVVLVIAYAVVMTRLSRRFRSTPSDARRE